MRPAGFFKPFKGTDTETKRKPSNRGMIWVSFLLAALFLWLALKGLDWTSFATTIRSANYAYLPLVFLWGSMNSWFRSFRWRILLTAEKKIRSQNVFWANMAGYLGNNILPARAGEVVRAVYVGKENEIPVPFALATGLVERFIDLLALVILGSISLAYAGFVTGPFKSALQIMSGIGMVGLVGILVAPYMEKCLVRLISLLNGIKPTLREKIDSLLHQFLRGVGALHHPARAGTFILFTGLIWLNDGIGTIILGRTLHLQFTFLQAFLLLAGLGLSSAIPSTPGYVGVYQFVAVLVLEPFGFPRTSALAFIIFMQITNFIIIAFWGGAAMLRPAAPRGQSGSVTEKSQ